MTPDKRERAIKYLTEEIRSLRMAPQINGCGPENWAEQLEIMESCLQAVRSAHFADAGKMQPLTVEQLREVPHGKIKDSTLKNICNRANEIAYTPAYIDREAWEPCKECRSCENCEYVLDYEYDEPCDRCKSCLDSMRRSRFEPVAFCSKCGRPLTEEAWAELEKRVRCISNG